VSANLSLMGVTGGDHVLERGDTSLADHRDGRGRNGNRSRRDGVYLVQLVVN